MHISIYEYMIMVFISWLLAFLSSSLTLNHVCACMYDNDIHLMINAIFFYHHYWHLTMNTLATFIRSRIFFIPETPTMSVQEAASTNDYLPSLLLSFFTFFCTKTTKWQFFYLSNTWPRMTWTSQSRDNLFSIFFYIMKVELTYNSFL